MKLLILSFYFPPDLSAGSFRISSLLEALAAQGPSNLTIEVLTTMPNRYKGVAPVAPAREQYGNISIRRFALPAHNSGMKDQSRAFLSYARQVRREMRGKEFDLVFATSSRMMTAYLGAQLSRSMKVPLYLDIRDLFTDTLKDVLSGHISKPLLPLLRQIEQRTFKQAKRINVVSAGFIGHVQALVPNQDLQFFPNGIDAEFFAHDYSKPDYQLDEMPVILYAGNIGEGQGLHHILPSAAGILKDSATFKIIGDGGRHRNLDEALNITRADNVELLPPVPREELHRHYRDADILFLHLNDYDAFLKVLPSKIFEYAATGKPILAGVSGYAADFLRNEVAGVEVFRPCDAHDMNSAFKRLETSRSVFPRQAFLKDYARKAIMERMAHDILNTIETAD